jgi:hypothetical protein
MAETLLGWPKDRPLDDRAVRFVASYFGLVEPSPRVSYATLSTEDGRELAAQLVEPVTQFASRATTARFGVATEYAVELAAAKGALPKARVDELVSPLYKSFKTVRLLTGAKASPLELADEPSLVGTDKLYGLGVAQGWHQVLGNNAAYVVLLLGTRR